MSSGKTQEIVNVSFSSWGQREGGRSWWMEVRRDKQCWCTCTEKSLSNFLCFCSFWKARKTKDGIEDKYRSSLPAKVGLGQKSQPSDPRFLVSFSMPMKGLPHMECPMGPCWMWILVWIGKWTQLGLNTQHFFFIFLFHGNLVGLLWTLVTSFRLRLVTYLPNYVQ